MKKFLFSIFAVAMAMTASAQTMVGTFNSEATTKNLTFEFDPAGGEYTAFSIFLKPSDGLTITKTSRGSIIKTKVDPDDEESEYLFVSKDYSATSNREGFGVYNCYSNDINNANTFLKKGEAVVFTVTKADGFTNGTIEAAGVVSTKDSKSVSVEIATIQIGDATGIQNVNATSVKEGKFIENGSVVIVKNGKKFNAAGAQMK